MKYETTNWTIEEIIKKILEKNLYLKNNIESNVEYSLSELDRQELSGEGSPQVNQVQRDIIWKKSSNDKFISSLLMNYPIPSIMILDNGLRNKYRYSLLDGKQRVNAMWMFIEKRAFKYNGTEVPKYKGKDWDEIKKHKKDLLNTEIPVVLISDFTFNEVKELFKLINVNSTKARPQELRHSIVNNSLVYFMNNYWYQAVNYKNSAEAKCKDNFIKSTLFNKNKILNRDYDEFLIKLFRLYEKKKILNDGKKELDQYYYDSGSVLSLPETNLRDEKIKKYILDFWRIVLEVISFYNENIFSQINNKWKSKTITIYIIFYLRYIKNIKLDETFKKNFLNFTSDVIEGKSSLKLSGIERLRNSNSKKNREELIGEFTRNYNK
ncbi:MAG: DUF262 domain-containing protein [Mycoplasmataceae bacterium]|nr:DUF262 domain-containing protein [Mycoplasmataceae bacterium]